MSFLLTPFAAFPLWTDNSRKLAEWGRTLYRLQLQRLHPRVLGDQCPAFGAAHPLYQMPSMPQGESGIGLTISATLRLATSTITLRLHI